MRINNRFHSIFLGNVTRKIISKERDLIRFFVDFIFLHFLFPSMFQTSMFREGSFFRTCCVNERL